MRWTRCTPSSHSRSKGVNRLSRSSIKHSTYQFSNNTSTRRTALSLTDGSCLSSGNLDLLFSGVSSQVLTSSWAKSNCRDFRHSSSANFRCPPQSASAPHKLNISVSSATAAAKTARCSPRQHLATGQVSIGHFEVSQRYLPGGRWRVVCRLRSLVTSSMGRPWASIISRGMRCTCSTASSQEVHSSVGSTR